jgi:hypothetical protein
VDHGAGQSFSIVPNAGYHVADVLVDGASVGAVGTYAFANVTAAHTIAASFAINTYTITATAGAGGSISTAGAVMVDHGAAQAFTISPNAGYHVADVLVDGDSVGAVTSYTFTNVTVAHTIAASFAINTYTITATAGAGGSISPSGAVVVNHGAARSFAIAAGPGFVIAGVMVDGVAAGPVSTYTFTNVMGHHTIAAAFTAAPLTPQDMIRAIQATIATLVSNQVLTASEAAALNASLDAAIASLDSGNKNSARGQLGAAVNKVEALVKSKRLTAAQGNPLIAAINAVIALL